jgi:bifunctional UDP-N-acetylglucosamine pyrophosphorylase / glucosamine-1-phosphate N-acetyltransferase
MQRASTLDTDSNGFSMTDLAIIVLAAGMGTRMKSDMPKVLHRAAGRSLMGHVLHAAKMLSPQRLVVVHGPGHDSTIKEARSIVPDCFFAEQAERRGTGHAVLMAESALKGFSGTVMVLYGDAPLIQPQSLTELLAKLDRKHALAVLGFEAADPTGYGRLLVKGKAVAAIREHKDATAAQRKIKLCNSGIIAMAAKDLWPTLKKLKPANAQGELYFTDVVEILAKAKKLCAMALCPEEDTAGVNDRAQLAGIEAVLQKRLRAKAMANGATLIDPATVYFSADTMLGRDIIIEPNVFLGTGVTVGDHVTIMANSHIEGASIGAGAKIGPFARLRPGADIGVDAHVGNFVEIKKAKIGAGAKANHLSYIGDAIIGAKSNIGAGTITCNYDGYDKHLTEIGEAVFIGSNSSLVAPVKIGTGANVAAGSVITKDVPEDALAITRPDLDIREGWAKTYRAIKAARKARKK